MGYSTDIAAAHEPLDMPQTPANVRAVRLRAGWNQVECEEACSISAFAIARAEDGRAPLTYNQWLKMLRICGQRVFDREQYGG